MTNGAGFLAGVGASAPVRGAMCRLPGAAAAETIARQGFDYIVIDCQHGMIGFAEACAMIQSIRAAGVVPLVRVLKNDPADIGRFLDAGAGGITVPMVDSALDAELSWRACRYAPIGGRSYGPIFASMHSGPATRDALEDVSLMVMIETSGGVKNVNEIAAVDGVAAIYAGPSDLALDLGESVGAPLARPVEEAVARILEACQRNQIVAGIQCGTPGDARRRFAQGFSLVTVVQDVKLLADGSRAALSMSGDSNEAK